MVSKHARYVKIDRHIRCETITSRAFSFEIHHRNVYEAQQSHNIAASSRRALLGHTISQICISCPPPMSLTSIQLGTALQLMFNVHSFQIRTNVYFCCLHHKLLRYNAIKTNINLRQFRCSRLPQVLILLHLHEQIAHR